MSIRVNLFPMLDKVLYEKIGYFSKNFQFYYHKDGYEIDLDNEANQSSGQTQSIIQLNDSSCQWYADIYDLCFKRICVIKNANFLFGINGIANEDAVIGIAVMWTSKTSSQRGIFEIGEIRKNDSNKTFDIKGSFPPGQLKGIVIIETIIYLKEPSVSKDGIFAKSSGTILGILDTTTIIMDGNGSVFPIVEVKELSKPLWYVDCSWSDPLVDGFDEDNVKLCINTAHPSYNSLKLEEGFKESAFLREILAGAMQTIVLNAMWGNYWDEIIKGESIEEGSIGQAINYFITTFGWDTSSPERLASSIRKDFDLRL